MKHEDEFIETIEEATEKLNHAVYYIKNKHDDIKKERAGVIAFLRSCLGKDLTTIHDDIREYLDNYDPPF